jgi:nitroreductase
MESFFKLAQVRRSTRKYKPDVIPVDIITKLQQVLLMSPASKRSNPWEFIFVDDKEILTLLADCKPHGASFVKDAPLAVVIIADPAKSDVWVEDTSIASIYVQLAAEDMGLGSCWVQVHKRMHASGEMSSEYIKKILGIPQHFEVESIISIGYKNETRSEFDLEQLQYSKIHTNTYSPKS